MGSYENIVKIEEMKKRVDEGDLLSALKVLETIEIKKIKNMSDLNLIASIYSENEKYEEAQELYYKIYEKTKSRRALYQLIEMLLKLNNIEDTEYYLKQYQKISPDDFYNYVFSYKLDKLKGESYEHLIGKLEELKKIEYTEKWAYELAKLYYKAGMEEECIRECSDIVLWFGEGTYVEKAKILRSYYSGETDKDRIIEEIKHRAEEVSSQANHNDQAYEADDGSYIDTAEAENAYELEENLYKGSDFMVHEDTEGLADGLKKDVQDIMEGNPSTNYSKQDNTYYEEQELIGEETSPSFEETTYYEEESNEDTIAFSKEAVESYYEEDSSLEDESKRDTAEQDEEPAGNLILKEESLDEEDKKLKQIMKEQGINPDEVFGNFLHVLTIKKQLVKSLETIVRERKKNIMMMITGTTGSGKTTLAKDIALFLNQAGRLKSSKVAKIRADKLNTVDILAKKDTLRDCCLVVENASELNRSTIESILELSDKLPGEIAVIFEENKKNMNKLFREYPKLMDLMKNRIHIPQYTQEDLTGFAFASLKLKDYRINPKAEQVLKNKISKVFKQIEAYRQLEQIGNIMQTAMDSADLRIGKQLSNLADQGRLMDVEILTVLVEDFEH